MAAIERDNPSLKGVLPKDYARSAPDDKTCLGQLIDLVSNIQVGDQDARAGRDLALDELVILNKTLVAHERLRPPFQKPPIST